MCEWVGDSAPAERVHPQSRGVEHLDRRIAIEAPDCQLAVVRYVTEIIIESLCRVEVALGERIGAARQRRIAVDDRHEDQVVPVRRPPDVAPCLVVHDAHTIAGVHVTAVGGEGTAHQRGDAPIHLDRVDPRGVVNERVLNIDAAAGADDQDVRSCQQLVGSGDDAGTKNAHVA